MRTPVAYSGILVLAFCLGTACNSGTSSNAPVPVEPIGSSNGPGYPVGGYGGPQPSGSVYGNQPAPSMGAAGSGAAGSGAAGSGAAGSGSAGSGAAGSGSAGSGGSKGDASAPKDSGGNAAVDWTSCDATTMTKPGVSSMDFCTQYSKACTFAATGGTVGKERYKTMADCMTKYEGLNAAKQSCVAYHLCAASAGGAAVNLHCPHPPEASLMPPGGPCANAM